MFKHKYLFIIISGILFSVPFIFPELNILSFFSGVPFFVILFGEMQSSKKNKTIKYTCVFGMSFYLPVYIWFLWMYPMEQTGVTPAQSAFIVIAAWLGFPVLQTVAMLILPIGLKIFRKIFKNKNTDIFFIPVLTACLYVILEWAQSWFFSGLTWAKLSISQYKNLFFIQSVSLFGTYFTSFVIVFINAAVALYLLNKLSQSQIEKQCEKSVLKPPFERGWQHEVLTGVCRFPVTTSNSANPRPSGTPFQKRALRENLLIFAVILLYFANSYFGLFRIIYYDYIDRAGDRQKITAQIIQGNISSYEKWEDSGGQSSFEIYKSLIDGYNDEKIDVCVLPETAIPISISYGSATYNRLQNLAANNNITLFTGIIYNNYEEEKKYNAIMAFDKNYDFIKPYGKRHLVPFGEYLQLDKIVTKAFPFVSNMSMFDSVLTPGESADIMTVNGVNYGGLVCFDSIFPELARKSVKEGADILIIVTNDSWFRDSTAIYQHNAQAVLRAVENNRYVVRSANTGVSSFISNTGKILQQSGILQREVLTEDIEIVKNKTVYTIFGDIILYLSCGYIAFCVLIIFKQKLKH